MKRLKTSLTLVISSALLVGCNSNDNDGLSKTVTKLSNEVTTLSQAIDSQSQKLKAPTTVKVAEYNLSFDRASFEDLVAQMQTSPVKQQTLIDSYKTNKETMTPEDKTLAEKIIQIRNVAAIIQVNRPDIIMMSEFNNSGEGDNNAALEGFKTNYLEVSQYLDSITGTEKLSPITYPHIKTYATNTGRNSGLDLDNNGTAGQMPGDAFGFGEYHGKYAFALMSKYAIDTDHTRTFEQFKWKDLPTAENPTITVCNDIKHKIPEGMKCGDNWYSDAEWKEIRLSSKNHVDAPIIIPTDHGTKVIHLLMSHPTPPVFDTVTEHNKLKNRDEIKFWDDYIQGAGPETAYIYDDHGKSGGLSEDSNFIILGDMNADPTHGDGYLDTIKELLNDPKVNTNATMGNLTPQSLGAPEDPKTKDHSNPEYVTSSFGLQVDHLVPSVGLDVTNSGVYWPAAENPGHLLLNDKRVGKYGNGKDISSDHRMIWIDVNL